MANVFTEIFDLLGTGSEAGKDFQSVITGENPDLSPLAADLLKDLADFHIANPAITQDVMLQLLELAAKYLEAHEAAKAS